MTDESIILGDQVPKRSTLNARLVGRVRTVSDMVLIVFSPKILNRIVQDTNKALEVKEATGGLRRRHSSGEKFAATDEVRLKMRWEMKDVADADELLSFVYDLALTETTSDEPCFLPRRRFEFLRANVVTNARDLGLSIMTLMLELIHVGFVIASDDILWRALGQKDVGILIPEKPARFGLYSDGMAVWMQESCLPVYLGFLTHTEAGAKFAPATAAVALGQRLVTDRPGALHMLVLDRGYTTWEMVNSLATLGLLFVCAISESNLGKDVYELVTLNLQAGRHHVFRVRSTGGVRMMLGVSHTENGNCLCVLSNAYVVGNEGTTPGFEFDITSLRSDVQYLADGPQSLRVRLAREHGVSLVAGGPTAEAMVLLGCSSDMLLASVLAPPPPASSTSTSTASSTSTSAAAATVTASSSSSTQQSSQAFAAATARGRARAMFGAESHVQTRRSAVERIDKDMLNKLTLGELKALCSRDAIVIKSGSRKEDIINKYMHARNPLAMQSDADAVAAAISASKDGQSPLNVTYSLSFKAIDVADQYKSTGTDGEKKKCGSADHVMTLHLLLALWVNVFSLFYEANSMLTPSTYKEFIARAVREEKARRV